jgi:hypothetical protein
MSDLRRLASVALLAVGILGAWTGLRACPFCSAVQMTFSEEIEKSDVVVLAKLVEAPPKVDLLDGGPSEASPGSNKTTFEITQVIKGGDLLKGAKSVETVYFGEAPRDTTFLITGIDPTNLAWSTPIQLSETAVEYLGKLPALIGKPQPERLAFFLDYLENKDELLARDSYDEFAKTPFPEVKQVKDRMPHDKLVAWVQDTNIPASRRRLYLTMLGIAGTPADIPLLEGMLKSPDRQVKQGLDAAINAYLMLKGPEGMQLVEDEFLKNKKAEYTDTYAAIVALRVHGQEVNTLPREKLLAGLRNILDRPDLADLVIPDLARWQDWSATDRLVELFKTADEKSSWVRVPVINFLQASPEPKAKEYLAELEKIDPDAVKRANSFFPVGAVPVVDGKVPPPESAATPAVEPVAEAAVESKNADAVPVATASAEPKTEEKPVDAETAKQETPAPAAVAAVPPASPPFNDGTSSTLVIPGASPAPANVAPAVQPASPAVAQRPTIPAIPLAQARAAAPSTVDRGTTMWVIATPLAAGLGLLLVFWLILKGAGARLPS